MGRLLDRIFLWRRRKPLQGVLSAEAFGAIIEHHRAIAYRTGLPFSLASFRRQGARWDGPFAQRFARMLARRRRLTDAVGWLDGGEIGVVLSHTDEAGAQCFADSVLEGLGPDRLRVGCELATYPTGARRREGSSTSAAGEGANDAGISAERRAPTGTNGGVRMAHAVRRPSRRERAAPGDPCPLVSRRTPRWKRAMDVVGASVALVLLSPVFLLTALYVRIAAGAPVLFRQTRVGRGGRLFSMLKFRTMSVCNDSRGHQAYVSGLIGSKAPMKKRDRDDRRIIFGGRVLRALCIDELPQLLNVLFGDMSLVGPRPYLPDDIAQCQRWQGERMDVRPGITGPWQVGGKDALSFAEMVRLDITYARHMTLMTDLKILLKTPVVVLALARDSLLPREKADEQAA